MTSALAGALAAGGWDLVQQLLDEHGPDQSGRCRSCRKDGYAPVFPCPIADASAAAVRLLAAERAS